VFNAGDPTRAGHRHYLDFLGREHRRRHGTSDFVGSSQIVARGPQEPVTIIAIDLGTCDGTLMYQAVGWYFRPDVQPGSLREHLHRHR
jgi:hypothetical protein